METFFKQIIKNIMPFFGEVQAHFVNQLYQCFMNPELSMTNMERFIKDYLDVIMDFDPDLRKVIQFITCLVQKEPLKAIDNIDGFLNLAFKVAQGVDEVGVDGAAEAVDQAVKVFEESVKPLIVLIKQWMKVVSLAVGYGSSGAS